MYKAKLTCGLKVLSNWLKLQGHIHNLLIVSSHTLYLVSGRISSVSLKDMMKNTSACMIPFNMCSLQLCWEEKFWKGNKNCSRYLLR